MYFQGALVKTFKNKTKIFSNDFLIMQEKMEQKEQRNWAPLPEFIQKFCWSYDRNALEWI
jgi:hypothetical protein